MKHKDISRKEFLDITTKAALGAAVGPLALNAIGCEPNGKSVNGPEDEAKTVVSIVKIENRNVEAAVEEAIDLLGGIETVAADKERIMLKPNLVSNSSTYTTKPEVVRTLAQLMKNAGKDVCIGEASASVNGFNVLEGVTYRTQRQDILDAMQTYVFDQLGYQDLADSLDIPLINLHSGEMVTVPVPDGGLAFDEITLHHSLTEIDMLCSVPMMKTHVMATVTLGMKNLIGLYPGTAYCSVRSCVHDLAADAGSPGIAFEIIDMVKANKVGLVVIDGSMAMEGNGPTDGQLVRMDLIIAGTNPLATDMVAAVVMGFRIDEIPTFVQAHNAGMLPTTTGDIEKRGAPIFTVRQDFVRPNVFPWQNIRHTWGVQELT